MGNQLPVRYRINALSPEDQKYLRDILNQDNTGRLLDQVEQTGKIPDEVVKAYSGLGPGSQYVLNRLQDVVSRLPSATTAKTNYLKNNLADTPNLSDAQLQEKLGLLKEISQPSGQISENNNQALEDTIRSMTLGNVKGLSGDWVRTAAQTIANDFYQGQFSPQRFAELIQNASGGQVPQTKAEELKNYGQKLYEQLNQRVRGGEFTQLANVAGVDTSKDQGVVGSVIADRAKKAELDAQYNDFVNTAPGQLASDRQAFYDSQRIMAKDYVTGEYAPQVAQRLNAMGLGDSGEVGAAIASKYSDLLGGVDASQLNQLQADTQFFGQQAYQKTFQDLIAARTDVSGQIANERGVLRTNQARGFANSQADLENKFNLDLFKQQSQAAYNNYQAQVNRQRQMVQDQNNLGDIGAVGQVVGQVAGAYAGSRGGGSSNTGGTNSTGNTGNTATVPNLK